MSASPSGRLARRQLLALAALSWAAEARADDVSDVLAKIAKARASIKTLQARFVQTRVIGLLASEVKSKGELTVVRPDRLRWELYAPDSVTYWIGPEGLAMKSAEGVTKVGKAAAGRFGAVLADLLVLIGGDIAKLRTRYDFTVKRGKGRVELGARPRSKKLAKHVARLVLVAVEAKPWMVERVEIHEASGDKSLVAFEPFVRDKPIKPGYMKPPPK